MQTDPVSNIFHEPSANGEVAPPPDAPMPAIPAMPVGFEPPTHDEHLRSDAERGASSVVIDAS